MAGTDFLDFYRSTFMGQRDQVNAEKKAAKAEAKAAQAAKEAEKAQESAKYAEGLKNAQEKVNSFLSNLRNAVENAAKDASSEETKVEAPAQDTTIDDENTIEYTYKAGDTFGQVIRDLGLGTDAGLWGDDGDVAYYTQQLVDQGALDSRGNIPIGTKIKLRRRGAPEITMSNVGEVVQEAKYPELQKVTPKSARLV